MAIIGAIFVIVESVRLRSPLVSLILGGMVPLLILGPSLFFPLYRELEGLMVSLPLGCLFGFIVGTISLIMKIGFKSLSVGLRYGFPFALILALSFLSLGLNETFVIIPLIIRGALIATIPILLFFEIYHFILTKEHLSNLYIKGSISGIIVGIATILYLVLKRGFYGEEWLAAIIVIFPLKLFGSIFTGLLIAAFYNKRGRTLLTRK